ncbi:Basic-leucine zipper domain-containing protein [Strongyloides ratti]|uniref:Basic-leucine zipper domain-containing protein n=1 Tax=Strongyloides ratti TaxID=34506 RepID=A0A090L1L0_STRRB|nr:Basic-leucine zipper domain-containing protein [Strongyloides ratti]CEF63582.1 Basic-leucine zipper domain-containing protein [Strongyloides ratti]
MCILNYSSYKLFIMDFSYNGNDPDFDKILNMLNDNDIKDPIEEFNCNYYYPTDNKTPSSTSSDSGRYSPTSIDSHEFSSNFQCSQQNFSSTFYNQESNLGYSTNSPGSLSEFTNSEYIPSPTTTNVSYFSQETGNIHENAPLNVSTFLPQNGNIVNKPIQNTKTNSVSNVVLLNPVKILHPGTIQVQPIHVISQQQPQVCFVLEDNNQKVQSVQSKNLNFPKNTHKLPTKDLVMSQNSSKLTLNQVSGNEANPTLQNNIDESENEFIRKREERKAKNRMAAHISRQRKKIEFNEMQNKLKLVEEENIHLKRENLKLKSQIFELEKENQSLRCPSEYKPYHKKAKLGAFTAVCMVGLICTFQFTSYFQNPQTHMPMPTNNFKALTTQQRGLQIKEVINDDSSLLKKMGRSLSVKNSTKDMHLIKNTVKSFNQSKFTNCSQFSINDHKVFHLNASAKNKINDELSFWFDKHEKVYENEETIFFDKIKNFKKNLYNDMLNSGRYLKKKVKRISVEKESNYPLSLPKIVKKNILNTLVDAMKRRNDTIYVMPKKNYYLLPAINRDNNTVPKMSLLIPSERISNSKSKSEITMLKIECEIVGTEYFNVPKSLFNYDTTNDERPGFI